MKLVFLGRLEDVAGMAEIVVPLAQHASLTAVLDGLPPELLAAIASPKVRVALNGSVIGAEQLLEGLMIGDADEVAFLPPVSGG